MHAHVKSNIKVSRGRGGAGRAFVLQTHKRACGEGGLIDRNDDFRRPYSGMPYRFRTGFLLSFPLALFRTSGISGCRKENTCNHCGTYIPGDGINFPTIVSGHSAGKPTKERYATVRSYTRTRVQCVGTHTYNTPPGSGDNDDIKSRTINYYHHNIRIHYTCTRSFARYN